MESKSKHWNALIFWAALFISLVCMTFDKGFQVWLTWGSWKGKMSRIAASVSVKIFGWVEHILIQTKIHKTECETSTEQACVFCLWLAEWVKEPTVSLLHLCWTYIPIPHPPCITPPPFRIMVNLRTLTTQTGRFSGDRKLSGCLKSNVRPLPT